MAQQGSHPPPSSRSRRPSAPSRGGRDYRPTGGYSWDSEQFAEGEPEPPPWAGVEVSPRWADREERHRRKHAQPGEADGERGHARSGHRAAPGFRSRLAAARARRTRRTTYVWGGAVAALTLIIVATIALAGPSHRKAAGTSFITTLQPGEFRSAPSACSAVTQATLGQYLPGHRRVVAPHSLDGRAQSLCNWTVDAPPLYRHLELNVQSYRPTGLATGNGSATAAATDAYRQALQQKQRPPKATHLPKALVTTVPGLGSSAFAALQVVSAGGDTTDVMTVVARDRNVLITVELDGIANSSRGRYGPVSASELRAGAVAAAREALSRL